MAEAFEKTIYDIVERELPRLRLMQPRELSATRAPGTWNKKQILGHLIDSASNNHQRFVRALLSEELVFPGYSQNDWVRVQDYADEEWQRIVDMWSALNRHLAHVVGRLPADRLQTPCRIGDNAPVTLEALIADYIRHLEHHLEQLG
ncbi:MAG TPA: DinB family protein [Spirochaetia bacterium]|nr:DinB family protein [Spirochaetia bacterium]